MSAELKPVKFGETLQEMGRRHYSETRRQYRAKLYPDVLNLYPEHTIQEVAEMLGTTVNQVYRTIKEYDIPIVKRCRYEREVKDRKGYGELDHTTRHRALYQRAYGKLPKDWHVHHIDNNKKNNNLDNLVALPASKHHSLHHCQRSGNTEGVTTILTEYLQVKGKSRVSVED